MLGRPRMALTLGPAAMATVVSLDGFSAYAGELNRNCPCQQRCHLIPSGKHTKSYGKSPFLMGKSTIFIAIFNCKLLVHQRVQRSLFKHKTLKEIFLRVKGCLEQRTL